MKAYVESVLVENKKLNVDDDDHNSIYSCGNQFNKSTRTEIMNG